MSHEATVMPEVAVGTVYGKHEIVHRLAIGGMAEIYLARVRGTAGFEKLVVLKRILPHFAIDPRFVQMFLAEAKLAGTLQHPNIADVYDVGQDNGAYYFTMEFVHGQDVRTIRHALRKQRQGVPLGITLAIVHGVASALDYAHNKTAPDGSSLGLVHRDVSASNIMISYEGAVKLLDFGIARASSNAHRTETGMLKGKIPYMSPEQCRGYAIDHRSDLWSLGVVLYELTVGHRPFRGDADFAIMDGIVNKGARPPRDVIEAYPEDLEAIVMKALARDPAERYANAEEMLHDLEAAISARGPWVSAKHLGKYMRQLFADQIAAWDQAQKAGLSLVEHVSDPVTAQSNSNMVTPKSLDARPSALMEVVAPEIVGRPSGFEVPRTTGAIARVTPPSLQVAQPRVTPPSMRAQHVPAPSLEVAQPYSPVTSVSRVSVRPRGPRLVLIGGIAAALAITVGLIVTRSSSSSAPAPAPAEPTTTIELQPSTGAPPSPPAPAAATRPPPPPPPPPAAPTTETAATAPSIPASSKPTATTKKASKTATRPSPKERQPKNPTGAKSGQEETWTQDTLFLPK